MAEFDGIVIFDGDCPFCSAVASVLRRLRGVGVVEWDDPASQSFLAAQFETPPFVLVFADRADGQVYVGREAARELAGRAGVPALAQDLVGRNYDATADAVRSAADFDRDPDDVHTTVALAPGARDAYEALADRAEGPAVTLTGAEEEGTTPSAGRRVDAARRGDEE